MTRPATQEAIQELFQPVQKDLQSVGFEGIRAYELSSKGNARLGFGSAEECVAFVRLSRLHPADSSIGSFIKKNGLPERFLVGTQKIQTSVQTPNFAG